MPLYVGSALQSFVDQVNASNTSLPWPLDTTNFVFSKPVTYTVDNPDNYNTQIRITAKDTSPYRGSFVLIYRRLDLAILFRSQRFELKKYVPSGTTVAKEAYIPILNTKYGINFEAANFTGAAINGSLASQTITLTAGTYNYQYVGSINLYYTQDLMELGVDTLTTSSLNGEVWPNGLSVLDQATTYPLRWEFLTLVKDYTESYVTNNWPTVTTSGSYAGSGNGVYGLPNIILDLGTANDLPINSDPYDETTNPYGLGGYNVFYTFLPINQSTRISYPFLNRDATRACILNFGSHPTLGTATMGYGPLYYNV